MITMRNFLSLLTLLGLALGLHAQSASTSEACHGDHTVHATNSGFSPDHLTIHAGESVEFIAFSGTHDVDGITNVYTGEPFDNPLAFSLPPAYSFGFLALALALSTSTSQARITTTPRPPETAEASQCLETRHPPTRS